jgi:hypothetical protein
VILTTIVAVVVTVVLVGAVFLLALFIEPGDFE